MTSLIEFNDTRSTIVHDDFQLWRSNTPNGFFLSFKSKEKANIHGTMCQHLGDTSWTTKDFGHSLTKSRKVVGESEASLYYWANGNGIVVTECKHCIRDGFITSIPSYTEGDSSSGAVAKFESVLQSEVKHSLELSAEERKARLNRAPTLPRRLTTNTTVFLRNPDVVAEVLIRANGKCESCFVPAPFLRAADNSPYLEIHHVVRLADGGTDTVANAIALCPNCHRKAHYG